MGLRTRKVDGRTWTCVRPGHWESDDDPPLQLYQMMAGTVHEQWEVWTGEGGETGRLDDLIAYGICMSDALRQLKGRID